MRAGHPKRVLLSALVIALLLIPLLNMASAQVGFCSIGGTENTVTIYPTADVYAFGKYSRPQLKFDIRGIPSGSNIISAKLCLYRLNADNWDGDIAVYRVDDQLWGENITAGEFDAQTLTNGENHAGKFMSHGWDNLDVLTQLKVDYNADHTYTSFRLRWANDNENEPSIGVDDGRFLLINGEAEELSIVFYASEYNGRDPYLEVTYALLYAVSASISPSESSGPPGETLNYTVTVKNTGNIPDNYDLTAEDNEGWDLALDNNLLENIAPDGSKTTTLRVTIPKNATPCTKDNITVIATSQTDNMVSAENSCIAHATTAPLPKDNTPPPTPSLVSPANGANITDNTPTFEWSAVSDPSGVTYTLQVDNDADFTSPEVNSSGLAENIHTPSALADENYSWHVRAVDGVGNSGDWSTVWTMLIDTAAPAAPSLLEPADGSLTNDNTPTFRWTSVTDPSGVTYTIQVDNDADFTSPEVNSSGLAENIHTPSALADENYSWHVRAVDGAGNASSWSENWSFTVSAAPSPPAPAAFTVSDLIISPPEVALGEEISISVTVKNTGDLEGIYTVTLKINDVVEAIENVTLAGGATKSVTFKVAEDTEGTYNVKVDGLTGSFSVVAPPPPGVPWIIIIALLVIAMAAAAAFYMWRRRKSSKHRARFKR